MTVTKTKKLHLRLNQLKNSLKPEHLKGTQKAYLRRFFKANLGLETALLLCSILESLLLVSLPIIMKYLVERDYNLFQLEKLVSDLIILTILGIIYIITSYSIIRLGQELFFRLTNQIKRHWLIYFFQTPSVESSKLSDGSLLTKMVYHIQLMRMGLERVILEGGRAIIFYLIILIAAFFFSSSSIFWLCLGFPLLCLSFWIAYLIGRYYISNEQTLNSRLIKSLLHQMNNLAHIQSLGLVQDRFEQLNQIIEQDTYFRKRRETWLKFSDRLIFAVVLLTGGFLYLIKDFYPILHWNNWSDGAVGIILTGFFTKILIQTVHAGIFWQALQTGLQISVPEFTVGKNSLGEKVKINFSAGLTIQGQKVKLSKFASPIKKFQLQLKPAQKVLIFGEGTVGKSTLAKYLCGLENVPSLNVKNDGQFLLATFWGKQNRDRQLISITPPYRESVVEFLLATPADQLDQKDLDSIFHRLKKYPQFDFIFKFNDFLGKRMDAFQSSLTELALLQIAQSVLRQPQLICIDHSVLDLSNPAIRRGLEILDQECAHSTRVYFSSQAQPVAKFDYIYELTANQLISHE